VAGLLPAPSRPAGRPCTGLLAKGGTPAPQVMHCYIDAERYGGLALDAALRRLLASFR
jgi:Sec7-like guanine-nucleotide exchange factor